MATKSVAEISNILQKDFVYLSLDKMKLSSLQTSLNEYTKIVNYCCFSLSSLAY